MVPLGALVLGVPLLGTVALVTFLGAYVPIIGAWTAGILVFALALADGQEHGVWGGLSEDERRALKRRNARARVRTA